MQFRKRFDVVQFTETFDIYYVEKLIGKMIGRSWYVRRDSSTSLDV